MSTTLAEYFRGVEAAGLARAAAGSATPAATAAAVHAAMAPLLAAGPGPSTRACREGCAACCHFPVGVTWGEAMLLAAAVQGVPGLPAEVFAAAAATRDLPWPELIGRPCPLLRAGRCAVYSARPLPCRALASADAEACAQALLGPSAVPRDEAAFHRGLGAASVLAAQHPAGTRELRSAVAAVLDAHPDGTAAHAAFAGCRAAP